MTKLGLGITNKIAVTGESGPTYSRTVDDGTYTNWSVFQCTATDGDPGTVVTPTGADTQAIIYKAETLSDSDFPMEFEMECSGIREFEFTIRLFDSTFGKTLDAAADGLQIDGTNSFRFVKSDFSTASGMTWAEVAYIGIVSYPYPGETADYTLIHIKGGVSDTSKVAFTFDDGVDTIYDTVYPLMNTAGYKGTLYAVPAWVGMANFMTLTEIQTLYSNGWDIGNHGYNHLSASGESVANIQEDYEDFIDWADTNGLSRARLHGAYPDGITNDNSDTAVNNIPMSSVRTIVNGLNTGLGNPLYLYSVVLGNTSTLSSFTTPYARAVATNSSLIILIHSVVDVPSESYEVATDVFEDILEYCGNNDVRVTTIRNYV